VQFPSIQLLNSFAPVQTADHNLPVLMHKAVDFFLLWETLEKELGQICNVPFWAIPWPAARALSHFILQYPEKFSSKSVLDFGCGCGIAGITAGLNGAIVTLNDIDPISIYVASINSSINNSTCNFLNDNLLSSHDNHHFDIILVADCFYEKTISAQIQKYLFTQLKNGSEIIVADGHRPFSPRPASSILHKVTLNVDFTIEGTTEREVVLFRLQE
jgi:predicted nicotinamide N-methyase